MKTHIEPKFDESYVSATSSSGLNVILWHKPEMKTTSCVLATPYGGLDFEMVSETGEHIHHPSGIAHFLEHKMFEHQGVDVMNTYSSLGANVNAFTSYGETMYYFSTTSVEIKEPLNLLMNFVQELNITAESVEKEKGIITQELMMYMQDANARLYYELFKALFHEHPYKYDIGGSVTSVNNTTLEQLMECHKINYHPKNMVLVCVGPKDPQEMMDIINENQNSKQFDEAIHYERVLVNEPKHVSKEVHYIPMDVTTSKVGVGIKLVPWVSDSKSRVKAEWAIRMALESHFSPMNECFQQWIDENKINQYFDFDVDIQKDSAFISFVNESDEHEQFKEFILDEMKKCIERTISYEQLSKLKKRYFGQAMRVLNDVENIAITTARNKFLGVSLFETLDILQNMDQSTVGEAMSHVSLENTCLVAIVKNNQKM